MSEYKKELMMTFQEGGFQSQMKKEMRVKLIEKLKFPNINKTAEITFLKRVLSSIISQNLTSNNFEYSNSVYLPEAGFQGKTLNRSQLLSLINLKEGMLQEKVSVLEYMVRKYIKLDGETSLSQIGIQTNANEIGYTLLQKQNMIERRYKNLVVENEVKNNTVQRIEEIRKEVQKEMKEWYEKQLRRFKEFEIQSVRLTQGQKIRRKYEEYTKMIEEKFRSKYEDLRKRQRKFFELEELRNREFRNKQQSQQHQLKQQRDLLDLKQKQVQEQNRLMGMQKIMEKQKIEKFEQQLRDKIKQYDSLNLRANQKIEYQVNLSKLAIQKEFQDKEIDFMGKKRAVDEEYYKMMAIKESVQIIEKQNSRLSKENGELRIQIKQAMTQIHQMVNENKSNQQKYDYLMQQKRQLQNEIDQLKKKNSNEIQKLQKLQHELTYTRKQLDQARKRLVNNEQSEEQPKQEIVPTATKKSGSVSEELCKKMDDLRRQRKKQIEKLKLELN